MVRIQEKRNDFSFLVLNQGNPGRIYQNTIRDIHPIIVHTRTNRHTNLNATRFSLQLVNVFLGAGNQLFMGFGGVAFIRTYSLSVRFRQFNPSTPYTYTVAGVGVRSSGTKSQNLILFKGGTTRYIFNKTSRTVTKISTPKAQKTPSPTSSSGRRKLVQKRAVEAEDIRKLPAAMGKSTGLYIIY